MRKKRQNLGVQQKNNRIRQKTVQERKEREKQGKKGGEKKKGDYKCQKDKKSKVNASTKI